ncbi:AAA family ATPase [Ornithinibacillus sp. FSL M8-0202]
MFFLQMSGFPGSGKSTLAREIASQTGAVLVNHHL